MKQGGFAREQEFTVSGMFCGPCVRAVTEAVKELDPAAGVQVDLGYTSVVVQSGVDRAKLSEAITAAGYEVA